jgi:hypothetical protein
MTVHRAVLYGSFASVVQIRNVFTADLTGSGSTPTELWGLYMDELLSTMPLVASNVVSFYQYELSLFNAGHYVPYDSITIDEPGTYEGESLPGQSAIVLIAKAAGLRQIGRKFLVGVPEELQVSGALVAGVAATMASILAAYITPVSGSGDSLLTPGIMDKTDTFRPFVGGFVSSFLGTMRRRKPGVGI